MMLICGADAGSVFFAFTWNEVAGRLEAAEELQDFLPCEFSRNANEPAPGGSAVPYEQMQNRA